MRGGEGVGVWGTTAPEGGVGGTDGARGMGAGAGVGKRVVGVGVDVEFCRAGGGGGGVGWSGGSEGLDGTLYERWGRRVGSVMGFMGFMNGASLGRWAGIGK